MLEILDFCPKWVRWIRACRIINYFCFS